MSFNPYKTAARWIDLLIAKTSFEYDGDADPRVKAEGVTDGNGDPIPVGTYLTDGSAGLVLSFSVGNGKGSTLVELRGNQLDEVANELAGWEPVDVDKLSPSECIRRTIARDPETGEVTFKVSLAKNSRTVTVPGDSWNDFVEFMDTYAGNVGEGVKHYRGVVATIEAEAAVKAAKEAEAKAKASAGK